MASLAKHLEALRELGCVVTGFRGHVELHHCHGGSMRELGGTLRGVSQKPSDWLQIPLAHWIHTGEHNPEQMGIETWERCFGRQIDHLETVCRQVGVNVFKLAGYDREVT